MAKFKARGRTELFRMVRQEPPDAEGVERKIVYAFMSDGVVLKNQTIKVPAHTSNVIGIAYTIPANTIRTGWKVAKLRKELGTTHEQIEAALKIKGFVRGAL